MTRRAKLLLGLLTLPPLLAGWAFWSAGTPAREMRAAIGDARFLGGHTSPVEHFPRESFYNANWSIPGVVTEDAVAEARRHLRDSGWKESKVPVDPWNPPGVTAFIHDGRSPLDPYRKKIPFLSTLFPHRSRMLRFYPSPRGGGTGIDEVVDTSR